MLETIDIASADLFRFKGGEIGDQPFQDLSVCGGQLFLEICDVRIDFTVKFRQFGCALPKFLGNRLAPIKLFQKLIAHTKSSY